MNDPAQEHKSPALLDPVIRPVSVTVCVIAYNSGPTLRTCLHRLEAQEKGTFKLPKRVVFVLFGNGFHELGAGDGATGEILRPFQYDWRNPVAMIRIKRLR